MVPHLVSKSSPEPVIPDPYANDAEDADNICKRRMKGDDDRESSPEPVIPYPYANDIDDTYNICKRRMKGEALEILTRLEANTQDMSDGRFLRTQDDKGRIQFTPPFEPRVQNDVNSLMKIMQETINDVYTDERVLVLPSFVETQEGAGDQRFHVCLNFLQSMILFAH